MTEYLIFTSFPVDGELPPTGWKPVGRVHARSAQSAIRESIEALPGEYVAVPVRSWKPVTVKVETKTALRFS